VFLKQVCQKVNYVGAPTLYKAAKQVCLTTAHALTEQKQGDQIGRIFADWAIAYFGQMLKIV
jgi:hypothetical protein